MVSGYQFQHHVDFTCAVHGLPIYLRTCNISAHLNCNAIGCSKTSGFSDEFIFRLQQHVLFASNFNVMVAQVFFSEPFETFKVVSSAEFIESFSAEICFD